MKCLSRFILMAAVVSLTSGGAQAAEPNRNRGKLAPSETKKVPPKITISKQTTYVVEPLWPDGYVNYFAVLNKIGSQGVTPENNGAVPFYRAFGPFDPPPIRRLQIVSNQDVPQTKREEIAGALGIAPLPLDGPYFVRYDYGEENKLVADLFRSGRGPKLRKDLERISEELKAAWLKKNERPLALIVQSTQRSRWYTPVMPDGDSYLLVNARLSIAFHGYDAVKLLVSRARSRFASGETDAAIDDLLACHRIARLIGQGPSPFHALFAFQMDPWACKEDLAISHRRKLTAVQLKKWIRQMQNLSSLPTTADKADVFLRFTHLDTIAAIARSGVTELEEWLSLELDAAMIRRVVGEEHARADWDEALRVGNAWYDRFVEAARKPTYRERKAAVEQIENDLNDVEADLKDGKKPSRLDLVGQSQRVVAGRQIGGLLLVILLPVAFRDCPKEEAAAMQFELTRTGLALEAYRAEHGHYPERLEKLVPACLPAVPKDRFTDADCRYRRHDKGYTLYSVGPNCRDDGGHDQSSDCSDDAGMQNGEDRSCDDIVVRKE